MNKGIILLLIYFGWKFYKFYKKSVEESSQKQKNREKEMGEAPKKKPKGRNIFQEILDEIENEKKRKENTRKQVHSKPMAPKEEPVVTSEKKDWVFGKDELKTSKAAHKRHYKDFVPSHMESESSEADLIAEEFDLKKAIIYSEIMNRPYAD